MKFLNNIVYKILRFLFGIRFTPLTTTDKGMLLYSVEYKLKDTCEEGLYFNVYRVIESEYTVIFGNTKESSYRTYGIEVIVPEHYHSVLKNLDGQYMRVGKECVNTTLPERAIAEVLILAYLELIREMYNCECEL